MTDSLEVATAAAAAIAVLWAIVLQIRMHRLVRTYRHLMGGVKAGNLEQIMSLHVARINEHDRRLNEIDENIKDLDRTLALAVQRVGLVRFNPFDDTGGNQSFAIALLDQRGCGLVVSSLHSRAETRVYAKPVEGGRSTYNLSEEEERAISEAMTRDPQAILR